MTAIKDIDVRSIQPIQEQRSPEKAQPGTKPTGADFAKELNSVASQLEPPQGAPTLQATSKAVDENFAKQHQQFQELMESRQSLAKLYQTITANKRDTSDKG